MAEPARRPGAPDPTHYPVSEKVPEKRLNRDIATMLRHLIERWLAKRGETARVGTDQFIYWVQHQPTRALAPDVYVLPGVDPATEIDAWKVWETGIVPSLAVEVVGLDVRKDYEVAPGRYDELGVRELVVYDPRPEGPDRVRFQVWRRRRGKLARVERTDADRVRSSVLGCWLREVGEGAAQRLRIGTGPRGDRIHPTAEEAERLGREAVERERDLERARRAAAEREGLERGARKGQAGALSRLLRLKFGDLPPATAARVREAAEADLLRWLDRILTAESLDDVFQP